MKKHVYNSLEWCSRCQEFTVFNESIMESHKMFLRTILVFLSLGSIPLEANDDGRIIFSFEKPEDYKQWQAVNDGVMGGRSDGRFMITADNKMQFFGNLSLENNGGFASVRSRPTVLKLKTGDALIARVRGDGRKYNFNLYVPRRMTAFSYRANFQTKKDKWIEVELPVEKFAATWFGRVLKNQPLDPNEVSGLGILLGDKKAGPFKLEVDWIKVKSTD